MTGLVAHLDAAAFYVNAERVRHPDLMGKPVGVLGNNGACVIAKSYEMKRSGVKTGTPIWDVVKLCPEGVYVTRDFYWYEVLSRKMLAIVGSFSPRVEYYSVDEFFFEAVPVDHGPLSRPPRRRPEAGTDRGGQAGGERPARPVQGLVGGHAVPAAVYADPANDFDICDVRGKICF